MDRVAIRKILEKEASLKYQKFSSSLLPGVNNLIGVRIPFLRKLAKRIVKEGNGIRVLRSLDGENKYFEEVMLQGFIIGELKGDLDFILDEVKNFIPKIYNWSICDSFSCSLKIFKKDKAKVFKFLKPYLKSNKTYDIRFSVVILLIYFVEKSYLKKLFKIFNQIKHDDYYVKMAVAWAISACFISYPKETLNYLKNENTLDKEIFNKSLQKIRESKRVSKKQKEEIKKLKR